MSIDIYLDNFEHVQKSHTSVFKAENILNVQVGSLYYTQDLGIDLVRFITPNFEIQPETFRSYVIQELLQQGVRVDEITTIDSQFMANFIMSVSEPTTEGELNV